MGKIEEILDHVRFDDDAVLRIGENTYAEELKGLVQAIIGPMEPYGDAPGNQAKSIRNELRAEQLKRLKEL